jgi:acetyltransferase-like isoleucine patch superfamily enzyme
MAPKSHGDGSFALEDLGGLGPDTVIEPGVLVFNPAHLVLGRGVYVGHRTLLEADTRGGITLGDEVWVGPDSYMHGAGGIAIGARTGLGPRTMILTSVHAPTPYPAPITSGPLEFGPVEIGEGCDIGMGAIILPGVRIGAGVQVGAGAVVSEDLPDGAVAAGVPARARRFRDGSPGDPQQG